MPMDGALINCIKPELEEVVGFHIEKIHIPSRNEFVFILRDKGRCKKLFVSISPDSPRIGFIKENIENPENPPMFCMLLRKYLCPGKITEIKTYGAERIISIIVSASNDLGDRTDYSVTVEILGHKTNLILTDKSGRIIDAARRSDPQKPERLIQPGAIYRLPENAEKTDFITGDLMSAAETLKNQREMRLCDALLKNIAGISPLVCREISYSIFKRTDALCKEVETSDLFAKLSDLRQEVSSGGKPVILLENGRPKDFSFTAINQYENLFEVRFLDSFSELSEKFFGERERIRRIEHNKSDLLKTVKNLLSRSERKLAARKNELEKTASREDLRICGELIKANMYNIKSGMSSVTVENYYDPEFEKKTIALSPALSPSANAAKYFKEYKKACSAEQTLGALIKQCEGEIAYLNSVLYAVSIAEKREDFEEIKNELVLTKYLKSRGKNKKRKTAFLPMHFSKDGYDIYVGRNNIQNEELTLHRARKTDLWFHTKNIPGSHVILVCNEKAPTDDIIVYAASLAAFYSKAGERGQIPVDYTPVKYVKKPSGSKPGTVIYTTNKTVFVDPALTVKKQD